METLETNLTQYAAYHRDRRNIATHFAGIPMIVFALVLALTACSVTVAGVSITGAAIGCGALAIYYLRQDVRYGIAMALFLFALCAAASEMVRWGMVSADTVGSVCSLTSPDLLRRHRARTRGPGAGRPSRCPALAGGAASRWQCPGRC